MDRLRNAAARLALALAFAAASHATAPAARADEPAEVKLPDSLSMEEALRLFRDHGLDLLIAEANVQSAEGDVRIARQVYNPNLSYSFTHIFNYDPSTTCDVAGQCSPNIHSVGLSDNAALEDVISGKRSLRIEVASAALKAARMGRADAQRILEFQVKSQYIQAVLARDALDFALVVQKGWTQTLGLSQLRYQKGATSERDEAQIETAKLESDQSVDQARQSLLVAKAQLAFLLGVRTALPEFHVEQDLPKFRIPGPLSAATPEALLKQAFDGRPDLQAQRAQQERAQASLRAAMRNRFPDIALQLGFNYAASGGPTTSSNTTPPTLIVGVSGNVPVFYQQQGEIKKAEADVRSQEVSFAKVRAQLFADIGTAFSNFSSTKGLVQRMEQRLLERARQQRDLTKIMYDKGATSLLEYLEAQRTYISTNQEYLQDLANYWTAVFQLEQAVGTELR